MNGAIPFLQIHKIDFRYSANMGEHISRLKFRHWATPLSLRSPSLNKTSLSLPVELSYFPFPIWYQLKKHTTHCELGIAPILSYFVPKISCWLRPILELNKIHINIWFVDNVVTNDCYREAGKRVKEAKEKVRFTFKITQIIFPLIFWCCYHGFWSLLAWTSMNPTCVSTCFRILASPYPTYSSSSWKSTTRYAFPLYFNYTFSRSGQVTTRKVFKTILTMQ